MIFAERMRGMKPSAIREILKVTQAPDVISFAGGLPAPELFPVAEIARAAQQVMNEDPTGALQYGLTEGHGPLRSWVTTHVAETVRLHAEASDVLITQGSQQALDLLSKVLLDPGDIVLVENPGYLGALQAFQSYQADVVGLDADADGVRPAALERALAPAIRRPKFLYLIPNYQNPTGTSMSAQRRCEIAAIAARHQLLVVEDDPYGRLRFEGEALPALGELQPDLNWVYLGTVSKILTPGLRVAWLITRDKLLFQALAMAKQAADLHTSTFTQRVVEVAVRPAGWLAQHVETLCRVYRARRDVMLHALAEHVPQGRWNRPSGGLFLWVTLDGNIDTTEVLKAASEHKVAFVPGAPFWVGQPTPTNTFRLNFSNASEERILEGMARLGKLLRAAKAA
jgi:2-aminoadipate transaminase